MPAARPSVVAALARAGEGERGRGRAAACAFSGGVGGLRGGVVSRERGSSKETLCGVTMFKYVSLSAR